MFIKFIFFLLFFSSSLFLVGEIPNQPTQVLQGKIYPYQESYVLQESGRKNAYYVLLESNALQKVIPKLDLLKEYAIEGNVYSLHSTHYLLPLHIKELKTGQLLAKDSQSFFLSVDKGKKKKASTLKKSPKKKSSIVKKFKRIIVQNPNSSKKKVNKQKHTQGKKTFKKSTSKKEIQPKKKAYKNKGKTYQLRAKRAKKTRSVRTR